MPDERAAAGTRTAAYDRRVVYAAAVVLEALAVLLYVVGAPVWAIALVAVGGFALILTAAWILEDRR